MAADAPPSPEAVRAVTGVVTRQPFGVGSKSEREGVWLEAVGHRWLLRRRSGPSFDDQVLEQLVGKTVRCSGLILDYLLLADRIEVIEDD